MATINTNLIIPEIYSQMVMSKVAGQIRVAQCAVKDDALMGKEGQTVNLDTVAFIGVASDWDMDTPMEATKLKQTKKPVTLKAIAAPGVEIADYDSEVAFNSKVEDVTLQQAKSIAYKHDDDAIAACLTSPLKKKLATKNHVTEDEMLGLLGLFGDDRDASSFAEIAISDVFATDFYKMDLFTSLERSTTAVGNGIVENGVLGYFLGIPVVLSSRLLDSENSEGFILAIKKNALKEFPKEEAFVETERKASLRRTNVFCSQIYAIALADESGVAYAKSVIG